MFCGDQDFSTITLLTFWDRWFVAWCTESVLCVAGCILKSLASTHQMLVVSYQLWQKKKSVDVVKYLHCVGGAGGGTAQKILGWEQLL